MVRVLGEPDRGDAGSWPGVYEPCLCAACTAADSIGAPSHQSTLYDDYRFVTRPELDRLGLTSAIGTAVLRPYMHGSCTAQLL
jgi:hypothetical protein